MKKVLIIGAAGYQASFVIERLRRSFDLTLADRVRPKVADLPFVECDVTDFASVQAAVTGQEAVVHLVALVRERFDKPHTAFADVMVKGTWNVAEACVKQKVRRMVNISSIVSVGWPVELHRTYRVGDPSKHGPWDLYYTLSKQMGEDVGRAYHQAHGLEVIQLRPGVIAGDGKNEPPKPPEDRSRPWFVYVDPRDVAQAVECALRTPLTYGVYNIVAGRKDSLFDWESAAREIGYSPQHNWPEL